jgi:LPXTG-motif cell wall-anchored protein
MVGFGVLFLYGAAADDTAAVATGFILSLAGLGGTIASGILLRRRKRDRDRLLEAHYGTPRRVQWDLAQSRVVF